eukprot:COSAG02_NODE_41290_length_396_cov_0.686869_1_plen_65_part_10
MYGVEACDRAIDPAPRARDTMRARDARARARVYAVERRRVDRRRLPTQRGFAMHPAAGVLLALIV